MTQIKNNRKPLLSFIGFKELEIDVCCSKLKSSKKMIEVGTVVFFDCRVVVAETRLLVDMNYHLRAPLLYKLNLKLTDIPDFSLMQ